MDHKDADRRLARSPGRLDRQNFVIKDGSKSFLGLSGPFRLVVHLEMNLIRMQLRPFTYRSKSPTA
jgi:hypothetical protein